MLNHIYDFNINFRTSLFVSILKKSLLRFWLQVHELYRSIWRKLTFNNIGSSDPWIQDISFILGLISFSNGFQFQYWSFTCFFRLFPKYIIFFDTIVNGRCFLFQCSDSIQNYNDFCILTFYLANLLNSLIGSSRFFVVSCLIAMARTSSTMNRSRDIIFLFLSEEESIQPFTIKYNVRCTFFINALNLSCWASALLSLLCWKIL